MNWKFVFIISLLGFFAAIVAVYFTPSLAELFLWLVVFIICAYLIARYAGENYFMYGFLTGIVICVWISVADTLLFGKYNINHRSEVNLISNLGITSSVHGSLLIVAPAIGLFAGCLIGLFTLLFVSLMKPKMI